MDKYFIDEEFKDFLSAMGINNESDSSNLITEFAVLGEPGTGKSTGFKHVADMHGYDFVRVVCSRDMTVQDLLLDKTVKNGDIVDVESEFLKNISKKSIILIDEFMVTPADVMAVLNSLLDFEKSITFPNGKKYTRHPENVIVFASNGSGHAGVKRQHGGFLDRLPTFHMDYPEKESEILQSAFPSVDEVTIHKLCKFAELVRNARSADEGNNGTRCSTRGLKMILRMHGNGTPIEKAVMYALKPSPDSMNTINEFMRLALNSEVVENKESGMKEVELYPVLKRDLADKEYKLDQIQKMSKQIVGHITDILSFDAEPQADEDKPQADEESEESKDDNEESNEVPY